MIDKTNEIMKYYKKVWGSEYWLANIDLYCGKILKVDPMKRCSMHMHKLKDETFCVRYGEVIIEAEITDEYLIHKLTRGMTMRIKPYTYHRFWSIKGCKMIEISTTHRENDSYRIENMLSGSFTMDEVEKLMENINETHK